eukprot:TRINITY_DN1636_c0_g1_i1.p1 TRINITY_DN1636_c0_g1~~TRINITY_DN1636_c0_g1_i1.p1  ORF type:complete len:633 (+),score=147.91 TRINITY_DN1636_c0_g1_i1:44-1942(+)
MTETSKTDAAAVPSFADYGLDSRLLRAIREMKFENPTPVQAAVLPLALKGKDILARAKTGSGKTAAFAIPVLQRIIRERVRNNSPQIRALIVVPTAELCHQAQQVFRQLLAHIAGITVAAVVSTRQIADQLPQLAAQPDILIATPKCIYGHLTNTNAKAKSSLDLSRLTSFVVDEADLVIQQVQEIDTIRTQLPVACQTYMLSATLSDDLSRLKTSVLNQPYVIKVGAEAEGEEKVRQYWVEADERDRFLLLFGLLRLGHLSGKVLIFTNAGETAYRLKMLLAAFGMQAAVLSSEVPRNARIDVVQKFNQGKFNYLIATDESLRTAEDDISQEAAVAAEAKAAEEAAAQDAAEQQVEGAGEEKPVEGEVEGKKKRKRKRRTADSEYGLQRGVDFAHVSWVVNFDPPVDVQNYIHRIGRTGRAHARGSSLTLFLKDNAEHVELRAEITGDQEDKGLKLDVLELPWPEINRLRYRTMDVLDGLNKRAVLKQRQAELARQMLNSEKLSSHFEENPADLAALQHLSKSVKQKGQSHLTYLPEYLQLRLQPNAPATTPAVDDVPKDAKRQKLSAKKTLDPLRSLKYDKSKVLEKHMKHEATKKQQKQKQKVPTASSWDIMMPGKRQKKQDGPSDFNF